LSTLSLPSPSFPFLLSITGSPPPFSCGIF
jgi:hypothetical protein